MTFGLLLAAALSGQTVYGPAAPSPAKPAPPVKVAERQCAPSGPTPNGEIVVCAVKPQGYRIDPDVLAAKKAKRQALAGRPKAPERFRDTGCAVIWPAGCVFAPQGINLLAAAGTIANLADRLSKGQEIGSVFVTDPQLSEYQLFVMAKKEREAKEAAAAAAVKAASTTPTATPAQNSAHR